MRRLLHLFTLLGTIWMLHQGVSLPARAQSLPTSADYLLTPATPNPFQTQTSFTLRVAHTQPVRIELFNLLGQRVRLIYEGILEAGTVYTFQLEAGDLPNGLYLCRIQGSRFGAVRRLTLLR